MKRIIPVVLFLFLICQLADAQQRLWRRYRYEVVASAGMSQFFGDVGGYTQGENALGFKDFIINQTSYNVNGQLKYRIIERVTARVSFTYGSLHASDEKGSNEGRGYEATTSIFEPALMAEYYIKKSQNMNSYLYQRGRKSRFGNFLSTMDVYAFTGFGGLSYNVTPNEALLERGLPTSGFTAIIPVGVGVNISMSRDYNLGLELGGRYAFSDYLDGYTSQYSKSNDVYYFLNFTFTYKILTSGKTGLPQFMTRKRR